MITVVDAGGLDYTSDATLNAGLGLNPAELIFENFDDIAMEFMISTTSASGDVMLTNLSAGPESTLAWPSNGTLQWDSDRGESLTFMLMSGVEFFGVGLSDHDFSGHQVSLNGGPAVDLSSLTNFNVGGNIRNGYLMLQQEMGDPLINSVTFISNTPSGGQSNDTLYFDHVAFSSNAISAVPEPSSLILLMIGAIFIGFRRIADFRQGKTTS